MLPPIQLTVGQNLERLWIFWETFFYGDFIFLSFLFYLRSVFFFFLCFYIFKTIAFGIRKKIKNKEKRKQRWGIDLKIYAVTIRKKKKDGNNNFLRILKVVLNGIRRLIESLLKGVLIFFKSNAGALLETR